MPSFATRRHRSSGSDAGVGPGSLQCSVSHAGTHVYSCCNFGPLAWGIPQALAFMTLAALRAIQGPCSLSPSWAHLTFLIGRLDCGAGESNQSGQALLGHHLRTPEPHDMHSGLAPLLCLPLALLTDTRLGSGTPVPRESHGSGPVAVGSWVPS